MSALARRASDRALRRQRGVGLIEVLIALVVVSLGVLGMAGLQLTGMKHSAGGFNRTKALLFAENMATRMRINPPAPGGPELAWENYDSSDEVAGYCATRPDPYCQASGAGDAASCGVVELAAFDVWSVACGDWGVDADGAAAGQGVREALPGGVLTVECGGADPCADDAIYTITVEWEEGSARSAGAGDEPGLDAAERKRVQMRLRP